MDFAGKQYYKLNRLLLLSLGLWPYQNSILKKIQIVFFQTLFLSFFLPQLNTFFVRQYNIDLFIKVMVFMVVNSIYIIKYNAFLLFTDNIRYIFERIQRDWNMLKSQAELKIIKKYAKNARLYTIQFFTLVIFFMLSYIVLNCIPIILNVIVPKNESRSRPILITMEFFVDQDTYFYAILTYSFLINYAGCVTVVAVATILIAYALHTCALFKITSYRIEQIFDKSVLQEPENIKQHIFYEKLIYAVYIHRRAMDLANILTNSFTIFYFVLLGFGVALMSLSLYHLYNALILMVDPFELLMSSGIITLELYYIFLGNYVGQDVIDTSTEICEIT
ncbi:uncharacterized protein LOC105182709 isoform X2 [Harpegnathos saltator]|nr:uncharacterized protein LOC105182709 isoform X2 [Harpegnathos saltator]